MVLLNIEGPVFIPERSTSHLKRPKLVGKANFSVSDGCIGMCQLPEAMSKVKMH